MIAGIAERDATAMQGFNGAGMPLIELNEAVTWVMGDERRTPQAELGLLFKGQEELRRLASGCRTALRATAAGRRLLKRITSDEVVAGPGKRSCLPAPLSWPPDQVLEMLGTPDPAWPPELSAFHAAASRLDQEVESRARRYADSLATILEAARIQELRMQGRCAPDYREPLVPISHEHFANILTIDGDRRHLIVNRRRRGSLPGFQPVPPPNAKRHIPTYYDVEVPSEDHALSGLSIARTPL